MKNDRNNYENIFHLSSQEKDKSHNSYSFNFASPKFTVTNNPISLFEKSLQSKFFFKYKVKLLKKLFYFIFIYYDYCELKIFIIMSKSHKVIKIPVFTFIYNVSKETCSYN